MSWLYVSGCAGLGTAAHVMSAGRERESDTHLENGELPVVSPLEEEDSTVGYSVLVRINCHLDTAQSPGRKILH